MSCDFCGGDILSKFESDDKCKHGGGTIEFMRNRLYYMCITFLNNVCVNNKTVYDEKSIRVYVEI